MDINKLKVGDSVEITDIKELVEHYIKKNILNKLNIDVLINLARLKTNKKYKISYICASCKLVRIKNNNYQITVPFCFIKK